MQRVGCLAISCDLMPSENPNAPHYQGNVLDILNLGWDAMIAHPSCTYAANSGVRWLRTEPGRWEKMIEAADFFSMLYHSEIQRICIENPIPHGYFLGRVGRWYDQCVQPWEFGHGESKATCFWLKNLPPLKPTHVEGGSLFDKEAPKEREQRIWKIPPSKKYDRSFERARTYPGIACAMADQWGAALVSSYLKGEY